MVYIVAVCSLIVQLVGFGVLWVYVRRTLSARPVSPTELIAEWAEMQAEWSSTVDMLSKQLKKLAKRERDALKQQQEPLPEIPVSEKSQIRALARQRGMIR